jgi:Cu(I)/Ag(I) efflux system membrane fusion protein
MSFVRHLLAGVSLISVSAAAQIGTAPIYYQDPSGKPFYSAAPKKDAQGRDYVPVYSDSAASPTQQTTAPAGKGKVLYYRNPMGLPDTSPVPKKDSMGMDYIPVYEDDAAEGGTVKIAPGRIQQLGVRTEAATLRTMSRDIRAVGTVAADERRIAVVAPKFEGWIAKLLVDTTGQSVHKGQPLAEVYSPALVVAEREYLLARRSLGAMAGADATARQSAEDLTDAALDRLRNWDISDDQLAELARKGAVTRNLVIRAPMDGIVMDKPALQGMHFAPGDMLYRITDLSTVWVLADVYEQDLGLVRPGEEAKVAVPAYPDRSFAGKVAFVYPTIKKETRTATVRIEISNPDVALKTDMYATAEIAAPVGGAVVAVPDSAVLDSGARQVVLIDRGEGRFEPHAVKVGQKAEGYAEIREGVKPGEKVVVGANFLIDAESNLRSALQAFAAPQGAGQ